MSRPGNWNVRSRTNDTWRTVVTWQPGGVTADLTGATAKLQVRATPSGTALLTAATGGGGITLGGTAGTVTVVIPRTTLDDLAPGVYVWDLVVTDSTGADHCILAGTWTHEQGVTVP